jgi:hypothetical protein
VASRQWWVAAAHGERGARSRWCWRRTLRPSASPPAAEAPCSRRGWALWRGRCRPSPSQIDATSSAPAACAISASTRLVLYVAGKLRYGGGSDLPIPAPAPAPMSRRGGFAALLDWRSFFWFSVSLRCVGAPASRLSLARLRVLSLAPLTSVAHALGRVVPII